MSRTFYNNCILFNNNCKKRYIRVAPSIFADTRCLLQISHDICNPERVQAAYRLVILTCMWHIIISV